MDLRKTALLVVHTHRHLDHRAGDEQFPHLSNVQVVGFDIDSVRHFYNFTDWPNGLAQINLGDRMVDVIPTPGHNETEVSFYDRNTGLFFSGDFLMPARLLVSDSSAYLASAQRATAFVRDRPISFVLGGHIELDADGETFPWESQYHPNEQVLQMTKDDLLALPAAIIELQRLLHQERQVRTDGSDAHSYCFVRFCRCDPDRAGDGSGFVSATTQGCPHVANCSSGNMIDQP
jgi:hydroxyacylglutathione hydrolase